MNKVMARIFARLVLAGRKTIDDVPEALRQQVQALVHGGEGL